MKDKRQQPNIKASVDYTQILLKAKNWHLFFLTGGLFMCFQPIMISLFTEDEINKYYSPLLIFWAKYSLILLGISLITFFYWMWSVIKYLVSLSNVKIKSKLFLWIFGLTLFSNFIILFILTSLVSAILKDYSAYIQYGINDAPLFLLPFYLFILFLFTVFSFFGMIYLVTYTSKTLNRLLFEHYPKGKKHITFLHILFFPIGIWVIQPLINNLLNILTKNK